MGRFVGIVKMIFGENWWNCEEDVWDDLVDL